MSSTTTATPTEPTTWSQKELKCVALPDDVVISGHHFSENEHATGETAKTRMRHISKDIELLTTDLPDNIFVRYAESRPDFMKILVAGNMGTPYSGGLFEFDLYCPLQYPVAPPQLFFRTTGGGSFRFNPNLYDNGKVCLSNIGSWGESSWNDGETIFGVLLVLQACVLLEKPLYNEPGHKDLLNAEGRSFQYNLELHGKTVQLAMLDWLEQKSYGVLSRAPKAPMNKQWGPILDGEFAENKESIMKVINDYESPQQKQQKKKDGIWDEVVKKHFSAHKEEILSTIREWLALGGETAPGAAGAAPPTNGIAALGDAGGEKKGGIVDESFRAFVGELREAVLALDDPARISFGPATGF